MLLKNSVEVVLPGMLKRKLFLLFLAGSLLTSFLAGFFIGTNQTLYSVYAPASVDFSLFWQAYYKLKDKFVDKGKINEEKIIYGAISGMVKSLDDPYTVFFPPEETKKFNEEIKGAFEGVGMEIGIKKDQLQVISPLEGTPAKTAGLRPADKILEINGTSTIDMTVEEAVSLIRGPKGTEVNLTIFRQGWAEPKKIKLIRAVIKIPSVAWKIFDSDIAYLQLFNFNEQAGTEFKKASFEIINSKAKSLILDLRNDPGGYLQVAQDIAGWFLEKGQTVVIEDFKATGEKNVYAAEGSSKLLDYPLVILINAGSASASEILAGALKDNRGIMLIGEKSFGKGSVQELENLRGGSSLKITVANWLTPKGNLITGKGLEPDVKIELTDKDIEEGKDPQLDKAIEIIKGMR